MWIIPSTSCASRHFWELVKARWVCSKEPWEQQHDCGCFADEQLCWRPLKSFHIGGFGEFDGNQNPLAFRQEAELERLEREFAIQSQITEAARRLASDPNVSKKLKKQRKTSYLNALKKLQEIENAINEYRIKSGKKPTQRASLIIDGKWDLVPTASLRVCGGQGTKFLPNFPSLLFSVLPGGPQGCSQRVLCIRGVLGHSSKAVLWSGCQHSRLWLLCSPMKSLSWCLLQSTAVQM